MSWRQDSTAGAYTWDTEPVYGDDLLCRNEELDWLIRHERKSWRLVNGRICDSGDPIMLEGLYGGLMAIPPAVAPPSVACTSTATPGVGLWTSGLYSPIPSNGIMFPSAYQLKAGGTMQTSTTTMTSTFLPTIAATTEGAAPGTGFKTLGPSGVATLATTALTAIFELDFDLILQAGGTAGTAVGTGKMHYSTSAAPATNAATTNILLGGTQATSVDFTGTTANLPGGLTISTWNTGTAGTTTFVPSIIIFAAWN